MCRRPKLTRAVADTDVLIAGGGFAGLALALALRQALGPRFAVTLADPELARGEDPRASAIAAAPRRMFEALGVWDAVAAQAQPILDMVITDSRVDDAAAAGVPDLRGRDRPRRAVRSHDRECAAGGGARGQGRGRRRDSRSPQPVKDFTAGRAGVTVELGDGSTWAAKLLVAADGGRSRLRERAGIAVHGWSYGQSAIVTTVAHERDHHGRAEEHFLPGGPFAILPLRHNRSSIVWTEHSAEAERFVALPDAAFHDELEKRFGLHLGDLTLAGPRRAYPLGLWVARSFIAERMALVGDAAHVIHPIAGQGLNMGLRDIAALAEAVVDAARLGLDPGDVTVLERYQRWRRFDTMTMSVSTDALNRLFSNRSDVLRLVRDIGLGVVDRLPPLKRMFMREAAGLIGDVPKLLRGEAL